jgi:hypothetical protein
MKYKNSNFLLIIISLSIIFFACQSKKEISDNIRPLADTIGFAQYGWQMDSVMARIERDQGKILNDKLSYSNFRPMMIMPMWDIYTLPF